MENKIENEVKQVETRVRIFNVKVLPKETAVYQNLIREIFNKEWAFNTRADKYMEIHSLKESHDKSVIGGELIYYTLLDGKDWYNKETRQIENIDVDPNLNPNAKVGEFFFVPEAHRFCFVLKSSGITTSQVRIFLEKAVKRLFEDKEVVVEEETSQDFIEIIKNAKSIKRIHINITYTNDDLTADFEELWDNSLRKSNVGKTDINAVALKKQNIELEKNDVFLGALELSKSNGYAEVTVKEGKHTKTYKTTEYPRTEVIRSSMKNRMIAVRDHILTIFRKP